MAAVEKPARVNPNTADLGELQTLPGVGPSLAERIVASRPFRVADDLRRVPGIGPSALAALRDRLTFDEPAPPEPGPPRSEFVREASDRVEQAVQAAGERWAEATGGRRLWVDAGLAAVAALLGMCLTLSVVAGINGSLDMSRQPTVRRLVSDVSALQTSAQALQSQIDSVDGRLEALEGLTTRMNAVESQAGRMRAELDAAGTQVASMQATVASVAGEMATVQTDLSRIDSFLRGLGDLLKSLYPEATTTSQPENLP